MWIHRIESSLSGAYLHSEIRGWVRRIRAVILDFTSGLWKPCPSFNDLHALPFILKILPTLLQRNK